jgi:hypothetical protein
MPARGVQDPLVAATTSCTVKTPGTTVPPEPPDGLALHTGQLIEDPAGPLMMPAISEAVSAPVTASTMNERVYVVFAATFTGAEVLKNGRSAVAVWR